MLGAKLISTTSEIRMTTAPKYVEGHNLLHGKSVLVTAAAGAGIGFSAALRATEEGCRALMISDIHPRRLDEAVANIKAQTGLQQVFGQLCDVSQEEQVQVLINAAEDKLAGVDVLINNAGLGGQTAVVDMSDEQWSKVMDITFLMKMDQPGIEVRGIRQLTGTSEFNEVFFDQAECDADDIVGQPGEGWAITMGLLNFERGVSTLGQQMQFQNELNQIIDIAKANGKSQNPTIRQRIADAHIGLKIMRYNSMRMLSDTGDGGLQKEALIYKLFWATWHRDLGELAMDVLGPEAEILESGPYTLTRLQAMYLFVRSDTIYGGTNEIQRNIIAERGLGMPKEPKITA